MLVSTAFCLSRTHLPNTVSKESQGIGVPVLAWRFAVQMRWNGHPPRIAPHAAAVGSAAAAAGHIIGAAQRLVFRQHRLIVY